MELEECCRGLESPRATDRAKSIKQISFLLQNSNRLEQIKNGTTCSWNHIIFSAYVCLMKDADKYVEDMRKKNTSSITKEINGKTFFDIVILAIKEAVDINFPQLLNYVTSFLQKKTMKELYSRSCMVTLRDNILRSDRFRSNVESADWTNLFTILKESRQSPGTSKDDDFIDVECLSLLIQWGPLYSLSPDVLKTQFAFVTEICKTVTQSSDRTRKEIILRLASEFCKHTAKDNRMACCKLGEDLFPYFTELYEVNIREDKLKLQLLEFFLLQVVLHHPKGAPEDHPVSCAHDWSTWIPHLRYMYKQLCDEISFNMKCRTKNAILFRVNKNDPQELTETFANLIVEVAKQVLNKTYVNVTSTSASTSAMSNPKRLKLDINMRTLISDIEDKKSWPLTQVMYSLLKLYPDTILKDEYISLLQCMETLQKSCSDQDLRFHVYKCLTVLKELEMSATMFRNCDTSHIWKAIAETTLKEAGLHLCTPVTEKLLQLLLSEDDSFLVQPVLKVFRTSSNVTKSRIDSLYLFGQKYGFPKFENNVVRRELMQQILNRNNLKDVYYSHDLTAKLLTNMILKQWPIQKDLHQYDSTSLNRPHIDIADIYYKTCFQDVLNDKQSPCNTGQDLQIPLVDTEMKQFLLDSLQQLVNTQSNSDDLDMLLNTMILLKNITSEFTTYGISDNNSSTFQNLLQILVKCFAKTFLISSTSTDELILKKISKSLELFDTFFIKTNDRSTLSQIISLVPEQLIKRLFEILDKYANKKYNSLNNIKFQFTLQVMKVMSTYCFISGQGGFTQFQRYAFDAIIDFAFNVGQEYDYVLAYAFLSKFNLCRPGALNEDSLKSLLEFVKKILNVRHSLYETSLEMLRVIKTVLIYVEKSYSDTAMNYLVGFLEILHSRHHRYGPEVSIVIIQCFTLVCQIDSKFGSYKHCLSDDSITTKICGLLCSGYQEVRFAAAKSIATFFSFDDATACGIQKGILNKIFELSLQVFDIQQPVSKEQEIDETVTRSASVLQTFTGIALSSRMWLPESLFCALRITHMKKLNGIEPVIGLLVKHFATENGIQLLEPNLKYIVKRWEHYKYSLDAFPFHLLNCGSKEEFCVKYLQTVMRLLIIEENSLELLSQVLKKDKKIFLQECTAKIFADCIAITGVNDLENVTASNETLVKLIHILGTDAFKTVIKNDINVLIYELLQYVSDQAHFELNFNVPGKFPVFYDNSFTVHEFEIFLTYLETYIFQVSNLIEYLMQHGTYNLHKLILALKLELEKTTICKSKVFHSYFIVVSLITKQLDKRFAFHEYFIRDSVTFLLNLMEDNVRNKMVSFLASHALNTFIKGILPKFSNNLCPLFHIIVNKLSNIALYSQEMGNTCIDILKILLIENSDTFSSNIKTLDPFPCKKEFEPLRTLHLRIRYENKDVTLQKDIEYFLKCGYETKFSDLREEGLKHLLQQLSKKKEELCNIYANSKDTQGNVLHELIIMLVKLTKSNNLNVLIEASRCLGELGVIDLNTLILEPDKIIETQNLSPLERLSGTIISHLQLYSIDKNVHLVSSATDGLFCILNSKEGRKVAKSDEEFICGKITLNYLTPFVTSGKPRTDSQIGFDDSFLRILSEYDIWCPSDTVSHKDWITRLVCCILKTFSSRCFLPKLIGVCEQSVEFCENILPYLLYTVLMLTKKQINDVIFEKIKYFFEQHWQRSTNNSDEIGMPIVLNKLSIKCMLKSIHYIRLQTINASNTKSAKNGINLNLDYLHLAQAAKYSQQHFTAILYAELWCQSKYDEITDTFSQEQQKKYARSKMLDVVYENVDSRVGRVLEDILRGSYKTLGEFDALHGCGTSLFLDPSRRVEHYKDLGLWDQALLYHEVALSRNTSNVLARKELVNSLKHCSLYTIPLLGNNANTEIDYECMWRLRQWDVDDHLGNHRSIAKDDFEKQRYAALKFLHENDLNNLKTAIDEARRDEIDKIKHVNLESCRNVYAMLTKLQSLRELENFAEMSVAGKTDLLIKAWELQNKLMNTDFEYVEPIKQQRIIMLQSKPTTHEQAGFLLTTSLNLAENARHENRLNVALRTLNNLRFCDNVAENFPQQIKFEDAQLCWALNDKTSAQHILRHLYNDQETEPRIRSHALKLAGKWFIESLSENKHVIIGTYLLPSLNIYKDLDRNSEDIRNIYDTYDVLGRFTDNEYQQIKNYMNSEGFQQKIKNMEKLKQAANNLRDTQDHRKLTTDESRAVRIHEQQSAIDACEIENAKKERNLFLKLAMKYYLLNLANSDQNNNRIYRLVSLFLNNRFDPSITETINQYLPQIPSYKYITILPQLVPHLSNGNDDLFVEHTNEIVRKCIQDHPYHTLPLILSLVYSNKDRDFSETTTNTSTSDSRIETARNLIKRIKRTDEHLNDVITKMEFLSEALIQLAYYKPPPGREKDKKCNIPVSLKLPKVKNYTNVLLPTCNLEVSKTCSYDNLIGVLSFGDSYSNVGGINAPKRITCRGTDGQVRTQLLKGHDDLRQDAVMQQVFTIMNSLLSANKTTKNLRIRTYKIVPLSMRSGILEWVENTIPIGTYLVGDSDTAGAHATYRPNDKRPKECRVMLARTSKSSAEEKLHVYNDVCSRIKPVFHKFFECSFPQPSEWYERRRAYICSVATSSMCGYILGIGDRHVQNILVDKGTAEVIHIDFGIAFEQGRCLPTPETVPFRLTRDVIDGMGVCGVDGVFWRSCERTMEVMRLNSQTILTIVEVLLYDPLYTWAVTAAEANKRQKRQEHGESAGSDVSDGAATAENVSTNITAERALMRLKSKLHGTEDGYPVSLEHQVGTLIQQAQDPANLCRLFNGWQAYL